MSGEETRKRLETRLAQLRTRTEKIEADLRKPGDRDWQERATEMQNTEVLKHLGEAERGEIEEIRAALARLDAGTYGSCERCGSKIQEARLEALPFAKTCIACVE